MADSDKKILITPQTGQTPDPSIEFKSGAGSAGDGDPITLYVTDDGTTSSLSFEGSAGQLFSISNDLTGTIFAVSDSSGVPIIEADADGDIRLAEFGGTIEYGGPFREKVISTTISTSTVNLDVSTASIFNITLSANTIVTFTNPPAAGLAQTVILIITHSGGARTLGVTNDRYTDGVAPTLSASGQTDVLSFFTVDAGANWYGSFVMAALS